MGVLLFIIHFNRIFPYKPSSYWCTPIYGNPNLIPWMPCFPALTFPGHAGLARSCLKHMGAMAGEDAVLGEIKSWESSKLSKHQPQKMGKPNLVVFENGGYPTE